MPEVCTFFQLEFKHLYIIYLLQKHPLIMCVQYFICTVTDLQTCTHLLTYSSCWPLWICTPILYVEPWAISATYCNTDTKYKRQSYLRLEPLTSHTAFTNKMGTLIVLIPILTLYSLQESGTFFQQYCCEIWYMEVCTVCANFLILYQFSKFTSCKVVWYFL